MYYVCEKSHDDDDDDDNENDDDDDENVGQNPESVKFLSQLSFVEVDKYTKYTIERWEFRD